VFAQYNLTVWPVQIVLNFLALAGIILLYRARPSDNRALVLSFFWEWMAVVYHFIFFTAINPAAWLFGAFFLAGALWLASLGAVKNQLQFRLTDGIRGFGRWALDSILPAAWLYLRSSVPGGADILVCPAQPRFSQSASCYVATVRSSGAVLCSIVIECTCPIRATA
jgi:Family of unknown function (DUF6064)